MSRFLTQYKSAEEWKAARAGKIGGSDIGAIVGVNPWRTPFDIYAEKSGLVEIQENRAMRLGKALEPVILAEYGGVTGHHVQPVQLAIVVHPRRPWAVASVDALAMRVDTGSELGVEAKSAGASQAHRWGDEGSDEVPEEYLCQCHWYRAILEAATDGQIAEWDLAVLIGGSDFRIYHIAPNIELEGILFDEAERFWCDHIIGQQAPPFGGSQGEREWISRMFPKDSAPEREATPEDDKVIEKLIALRAELGEREREMGVLEAELKMRIGESAGLISRRFGRITWRKAKDTELVNWQAVAEELAAPADLIKKHTAIKAGARRLLLPRGGKI